MMKKFSNWRYNSPTIYTPMVVYLASMGSLISYKLGARRMIPPEPRKQVIVKSQRKSLSSTIAMYFQSSMTSLSLSLFLMCWAMNWTPFSAISTSGLNLWEEAESCKMLRVLWWAGGSWAGLTHRERQSIVRETSVMCHCPISCNTQNISLSSQKYFSFFILRKRFSQHSLNIFRLISILKFYIKYIKN